MEEKTFKDIHVMVQDILAECVDKGMTPPFVFCALSRKGSILALRVTDMEPDVLAEHYEGPGFDLPMTIFILDQKNKSSKIIVEGSGRSWQ